MQKIKTAALGLCGALALYLPSAQAVQIQVEVENKSPTGGLYFTPVWLGFHNGSFDTFDVGSNASPELERLAEDGNAAPLGAALTAAQSDAVGGVVLAPAGFPGAPVFDPTEVASSIFDLDPSRHRFFNYASMIIPSNDAFFGNDLAQELFTAAGDFVGDFSISVLGINIYDAGTEANTETQAPFLNQTGPNLGTTTADPIALHGGFLPVGTGNILGGTTAAGTLIDPVLGDFTRNGGLVEIAEIRISQVPEPSSAALLAIAALGGIGLRKRQKAKAV